MSFITLLTGSSGPKEMVSYSNINEEVRHAYNHLRLIVDGVLQLLKIYRPLGGGGSPRRAILGRVKRDVADLSTGHLDVANVPLGPSDGFAWQ